MLFAINPGGAAPSQPLPISFPNVTEAAPGTTADMNYFDRRRAVGVTTAAACSNRSATFLRTSSRRRALE
jgi:hypothetical protein